MTNKKLSSVAGDYPSVEEIRFLNCRRLIATHNLNLIEFGKTIKKSPSYAGMLAGLGEHKTLISRDMARHIEQCFLLPKNFLDNMHDFDSEAIVTKLKVNEFRELRDAYLAERALLLENGLGEFSVPKKSQVSSIAADRMSETVAKSLSLKYAKDSSGLLERLSATFTFADIGALADHVVDFLSRDTSIKITKPYKKTIALL